MHFARAMGRERGIVGRTERAALLAACIKAIPARSSLVATRGGTMFWFWLNIPMATACFAAWCGIPLWMVLRHPNWGPEPGHGRDTGHSAQRPGLEPTFVLSGNRADTATVGAGTGG
jgi:hypothetical protein